MTDMLDAARGTDQFANIRAVLDDALVEDPETGRYQVRRSVFTDEQLFELEMTHIFEGNWIYLAHESQIPNVGDYFTTYMGRQPIVITRNKDGELGALINACSHRGAMLCRRKTDNRNHLHLPVPRLDLQQQRKTPQGQGRSHRWLSGAVQQRRLTRPDQGGAVRELSRLPLRQPQPRRAATRRAPR